MCQNFLSKETIVHIKDILEIYKVLGSSNLSTDIIHKALFMDIYRETLAINKLCPEEIDDKILNEMEEYKKILNKYNDKYIIKL